VFGTVNSLRDRLDGARQLHENVATLAGRPSSPNDPAAFLSLIAQTLNARVATLREMDESGDWTPPREVTSALRDIGQYGDNIDSHLEDDMPVNSVLTILLGTEYAVNMKAIQHLQNRYAESLPDAVLAGVSGDRGASNRSPSSVSSTRRSPSNRTLRNSRG